MINSLKDGNRVKDYFLIKEATKGVSTTGLNYLNIILQDKTGVIEAKKRDINQKDIDTFKPGEIVQISGDVYDYKGKLQIKIYSAEVIDKKFADLENFIIDSPKPFDKLVERFNYFKNSVENKDCKLILDRIFEKYFDKYSTFPAATKNHHEFYHGLLYHSVSMCEMAEAAAKNYENINRDLLITGCLLHDIGKIVELSGPIATKYTDEGNLLGHLTIGFNIVKDTCDELKITSDVPLQLEHMILSHHGKLEFGACVTPLTREALILSMIDDMDAKMMMLDKALAEVKPGEYSEKIFGLDNRAFYKGEE
ncbi:MAG: HD domain-containing protein [Bacilli bacterium]|nr:HD domain-containing protein [Bacilli bacterium]